MPTRVAVLVFPDVELLDFAGPFEVFTCARDERDEPLFDTTIAAPRAGTLGTRHGLFIVAEHALESVERPEIVVVPGGFGVRALLEDEKTLARLRTLAAGGTVVASVCTGAWLLGRAGLLEGRRATTHHLCFDRLRELAPSATIETGDRVVDEGQVVTSGGISAGIDMALHLVTRFHGREAAERTARYMEYAWPAAS